MNFLRVFLNTIDFFIVFDKHYEFFHSVTLWIFSWCLVWQKFPSLFFALYYFNFFGFKKKLIEGPAYFLAEACWLSCIFILFDLWFGNKSNAKRFNLLGPLHCPTTGYPIFLLCTSVCILFKDFYSFIRSNQAWDVFIY